MIACKREGLGMRLTELAATYVVYKSQVRCYRAPYEASNICIAWISLKTLLSLVLESFLLTTIAFHAFSQVLNGQDEQQLALFKTQNVLLLL